MENLYKCTLGGMAISQMQHRCLSPTAVSTRNLLEVKVWLGGEESMANKEQSCNLGFLFIFKKKHPNQYTMKLNFYSYSLILVIASSIPKGEISLVSNSTLKGNDTIFTIFRVFSYQKYYTIIFWTVFQNYVLTIVTKHTWAWNNITSDHLNWICVFISSPSCNFLSSKKGLGRMQDYDKGNT